MNWQSIHYTNSGGDGPPAVFTGALMCDTVVLQPLTDTLAEAGYIEQSRTTVAHRGSAEYGFVDSARDMLGLADALGFRTPAAADEEPGLCDDEGDGE